ncbi:MAG: helix-hairpin-helix domain-containing protein [Bacteroidota bacterium]
MVPLYCFFRQNFRKSKSQYKVTFEVDTDQIGKGRDVRVLASFNDWSWDNGLVMKNGKGTYKATAELPAGHYQFRYLADGWDWKNDDSAEAYADSGYGTTNCCFALEAVKPAAKKAPAKKPAAKKAAPAKKAATKKADDLKRIEGIGPKISGLLNEAGITTFDGLAKASKKKLQEVLAAAGSRFRLAKPDTWQQQAKLAAADKLDELKKLQDELKGGVRK